MSNVEKKIVRQPTVRHSKNTIIKSYLKKPKHHALLEEFLQKPTEENKENLDQSFKNFFLEIKFTSYLSKAIYFNAINYDKKSRLQSERNQLILDKPFSKDDDITLIENVSVNEDNPGVDSPNLEDHITDYLLYEALQELTENQRSLLSLAYIYEFNDSEIAKMLGKSQQAVSKSHKNALRKLKKFLESKQKEV